jgi:hypothetical protein
MTFPGKLKGLANRWLEHFDVRIESLTAERTEIARLLKLDTLGQFGRPVFPTLSQFLSCNPAIILEAVGRFNENFLQVSVDSSAADYSHANDYFTSPDAEVAYALVRTFQPRRLVEIGSGNSTQLFRKAIEDGKLKSELVSIDPSPRKAVEGSAHRIIRQRLEELPESYFCKALEGNDILFVDSSHQVRIGNDVVKLLNIIPILKKDVLIHFHDIFLPYEYPRHWMVDNRWDWNEQYFVQALLQGSDQFEVLWPGHYLQKTMVDFTSYFTRRPIGTASSLWLRKIK